MLRALGLVSAGDFPYCWIHTGCQSPAEVGWSNQGSMGPGYYCTDGVFVDQHTSFDSCYAQPYCPSPLTFSEGAWKCMEGSSSKVHDRHDQSTPCTPPWGSG